MDQINSNNTDFMLEGNETYEEKFRRNHFFRGMKPEKYHKIFDGLYHSYLEQSLQAKTDYHNDINDAQSDSPY
jgi:hypothetical protein